MSDASRPATTVTGSANELIVGPEPSLPITSFSAPPPDTFDGFRWDGAGVLAPFLYLAYKARRGDAVARELLTALRVTISDCDGKSYWPMAPGESPPDPVTDAAKALARAVLAEPPEPEAVWPLVDELLEYRGGRP